MISALLYLRLVSARNRAAAAVGRLRQPKYLAGALAGAAYFYYFLIRPIRAPIGGASLGGLAAVPPGASAAGFAAVASAILFVLVLGKQALVWLSPPAQPGLRFSESEIAFLFPAPLTRRRLVQFSLVSTQLMILLSSLLLTILSNRWRSLGGNPLTHALGWWVILSTLSLHSTAIGLVVGRRAAAVTGFGRDRAVALAVIAAIWAGAALSVWTEAGRMEPVSMSGGPYGLLAGIGRFLDSGALHWILWPFRWTAAPFLASDLRGFLIALGPALVPVAALYGWIIRLEVSFEEGSIARAEKRAQARAARHGSGRSGSVKPKARREPFRLVDQGRPELAFLWKNLLAIQSWFSLRVAAAAVAVVAVIAAVNLHPAAGSGRGEALASIVIVIAGIVSFYTLLVGPQLVRQDIRHDLVNADILKTYPLAGWQVILGELLTPIAILSGLLWLALLAATWALGQLGGGELIGGGARPIVAGCLAFVVPPLCALQLLIPNALALVFPGWYQAVRSRGGGLEMVGQRLIFAFGQWLAVALAVLPAVLLAPAVFLAARFWVQLFAPEPVAVAASAIIATAAALVILVGEVWCGIWWLGERFEKLDLSSASR